MADSALPVWFDARPWVCTYRNKTSSHSMHWFLQISEDEGFAGSLSRSASKDHLSPLDVSWEDRDREEDLWDFAVKAKPKTHHVWEQVGR